MKVFEHSFARFVYPFLFEAESFPQRVESVDAATYKAGKTIWTKQRFPEGELLPHVARYLNPPQGTPPTARLWQMDPNAAQSLEGLGAMRGVEWFLVHRRRAETPFTLDDVQLVLFRVGVGFLTVKASPKSTELDDWLDFLHYFRFIRRPRSVSLHAKKRTGIDANKQPVFEDYFPPLAGGLPEGRKRPPVFGDVVDGLLRSGEVEGETGAWWSEVFIANQTLPYVVLLVDGVSEQEQYRLLYKLHNSFHSKEGEHPAPEDLRPDQEHLLGYADRQWFVFSLDGGAFVACDPPDSDFFRINLPQHLDTQYLLVFLLALHQRFALMGLSEQVTKHWLVEHAAASDADTQASREWVFRRIRDLLLSFTARGHFTQVMQRRHHHRCYLKWQETFQVDQLFQEVNDEVRDMHGYLLMEKTERIERLSEERKQQAEQQRQEMEDRAQEEADRAKRVEERLNLLAAFFAVPALILALLEVLGPDPAWPWVILGLGLGAVGAFSLKKYLEAGKGETAADREPADKPPDPTPDAAAEPPPDPQPTAAEQDPEPPPADEEPPT